MTTHAHFVTAREIVRPVDNATEDRIRAEYRELPGLCLTTEQAMRLWTLDRPTLPGGPRAADPRRNPRAGRLRPLCTKSLCSGQRDPFPQDSISTDQHSTAGSRVR